jgi:glucosamine--fructose-6-phosphate aminotransferase (isomerizing)
VFENMCGIIGVIGYCKCIDILISGLKQLENRGYDSAGICTHNSDKNSFIQSKYASTSTENSISKLLKDTLKHSNSNLGIGHTRWATHGPKTDKNAHPHFDMYKRLSLVHNGIIENYQELKEELLEKGYTFRSETDSEVIANLISSYLISGNEPKQALEQTIQRLSGTYALAVLFLQDPDSLYCVRFGSPLLIGFTEKYAIVTSEPSGFNEQLVNYFVLDNDNICILYKRHQKVNMITKRNTLTKMSLSSDYSANIGGFPHWTLKEIHEQTQSTNRTMNNGGRILDEHRVRLGGLEVYKDRLSQVKHLILLGCGTSYHAGLISLKYFKDLCHFTTVQVFDGAEFNPEDFPNTSEKIGIIFLSQSGETQDLYRCIKFSRKENIYLIGVVNVVDSLISREVDCGVYLNAGREVAVASTKSFTSQLTALLLIACWFSQNQINNYMKRVRYVKDLNKLPRLVKETIEISEKHCPELVKYFDNFSSCFIIGKGTGEGIAKEAALKIKEISYIHAEGYSSSSLKHGPFALLRKDFPTIIIGLDNDHFDKCLNALEEIKSRNGKVIFITNKELQRKPQADYIIQLPTKTKVIGDILSIIPLQMLAYYLSLRRNINPDFPRNLAKVVTVE